MALCNIIRKQVYKENDHIEKNRSAARITGILDNISRLNNTVCAMGSLDIQRYPDNYEVLSTQAALAAEKIACQLRSLLYATTHIPKAEYLAQASDAHGIEVSQKDGVLQITLPCLLPKKQSRQSALFLGDPLHMALKEYLERHPITRFRECTVCFFHVYGVYGNDLPIRKLPDFDNLQHKQVLDIIALHTMTADNSILCDMFNAAGPGEQSCTKVFVMERNRFPAWYAQYEKAKRNI